MPIVRLKPGREKSLLNGHPWVFGGAIAQVTGQPAPADVVDVLDSRGGWLARGYYNAASQIVVRVLTWDENEAIDTSFWRRRLEAALRRRSALLAREDTDACRLVYAESDGLPGLIVDRYGDWLVLQSLTLGIEPWKPLLADLLSELFPSAGIYERSDADVREHEGLVASSGPLVGQAPPEALTVIENGLRFQVDIVQGHKTGFYLDQRENRRKVAAYCRGKEVLNAFAYTGGFAVYAAAGGAVGITNLDTSTEALDRARANQTLNGLARETDEYVTGDAFVVLRTYRDRARAFDVIILDPPKFAFSRAQIPSATRGYKDINLLAMRLLRPGGILATFSCSGLVSEDLFQKVLFGASVDARREVRILERLGQGSDHPVLLTFPEAAYLKGFVCQVE